MLDKLHMTWDDVFKFFETIFNLIVDFLRLSDTIPEEETTEAV